MTPVLLLVSDKHCGQGRVRSDSAAKRVSLRCQLADQQIADSTINFYSPAVRAKLFHISV